MVETFMYVYIYKHIKSHETMKYLENKTFEEKWFHIKIEFQQMHRLAISCSAKRKSSHSQL